MIFSLIKLVWHHIKSVELTDKVPSYPSELSNERLAEIKNEINGDIRIYLKNCSENYLEYINAVQKLFPEVYEQMEKFDSELDMISYLSDLDKAKKSKDARTEYGLLKNGVEKRIYTPATYDRLAMLHEKNGQLEKVRDVCLTWFETDFWKLPNTWKGSLRILDRLEKIEKNSVPNNTYNSLRWKST